MTKPSIEAMKVCTSCGKDFPPYFAAKTCSWECGVELAKTAKQRARANHRRRYQTDPEFRQRVLDKQREWRERNPERLRENALKKKYGLTADAFDAILNEQGGGCAICGRSDRQWHVDHAHDCCPGVRSCGACVRGILCGNCNRGIGQFGESAEVVAAAADYMRRFA